MKTIEQLQAEQAKALAALKAEHELAALMPAPPTYVSTSRLTGSPWVSYKVEGLRGALELFKLFTVVPFAEYRDGCLSLKPGELLKPEARDKFASQWAYSIDVSTNFESHCGAGTTLKIKFFARVPGVDVPVHVTADVTGPGYIGSFNALGASCQWKANKVVRGSKAPNRALCGVGRLIAWGTGSEEWANYSYLVSAEYADIDQSFEDLREAMLNLQNLSDEFDAKVAQ